VRLQHACGPENFPLDEPFEGLAGRELDDGSEEAVTEVRVHPLRSGGMRELRGYGPSQHLVATDRLIVRSYIERKPGRVSEQVVDGHRGFVLRPSAQMIRYRITNVQFPEILQPEDCRGGERLGYGGEPKSSRRPERHTSFAICPAIALMQQERRPLSYKDHTRESQSGGIAKVLVDRQAPACDRRLVTRELRRHDALKLRTGHAARDY
jgi:hypothetical protein